MVTPGSDWIGARTGMSQAARTVGAKAQRPEDTWAGMYRGKVVMVVGALG